MEIPTQIKNVILAVIALISLTATTIVHAQSGYFHFGYLGDTGYSNSEQTKFLNMLQTINQTEQVSFLIHVGDFKGGSQACTDAIFQDRLNGFNTSNFPFIFTPGDNEWTDCRSGSPSRDPVDALNTLRTMFFNTGESLGINKIPLVRQSDSGTIYSENARWVHNDVMFITINVPGLTDNCAMKGLDEFGNNLNTGDTSNIPTSCSSEKQDRQAANIAWINEAFDIAIANNYLGVVIGSQSEMDWGGTQDDGSCSSSAGSTCKTNEAYRIAIIQRSQEFGKPVLYLHGDLHSFHIRMPSATTPNFTEVQTYGSPSINWVRIVVDPTNPELFTIMSGSTTAPAFPSSTPTDTTNTDTTPTNTDTTPTSESVTTLTIKGNADKKFSPFDYVDILATATGVSNTLSGEGLLQWTSQNVQGSFNVECFHRNGSLAWVGGRDTSGILSSKYNFWLVEVETGNSVNHGQWINTATLSCDKEHDLLGSFGSSVIDQISLVTTEPTTTDTGTSGSGSTTTDTTGTSGSGSTTTDTTGTSGSGSTTTDTTGTSGSGSTTTDTTGTSGSGSTTGTQTTETISSLIMSGAADKGFQPFNEVNVEAYYSSTTDAVTGTGALTWTSQSVTATFNVECFHINGSKAWVGGRDTSGILSNKYNFWLVEVDTTNGLHNAQWVNTATLSCSAEYDLISAFGAGVIDNVQLLVDIPQ